MDMVRRDINAEALAYMNSIYANSVLSPESVQQLHNEATFRACDWYFDRDIETRFIENVAMLTKDIPAAGIAKGNADAKFATVMALVARAETQLKLCSSAIDQIQANFKSQWENIAVSRFELRKQMIAKYNQSVIQLESVMSPTDVSGDVSKLPVENPYRIYEHVQSEIKSINQILKGDQSVASLQVISGKCVGLSQTCSDVEMELSGIATVFDVNSREFSSLQTFETLLDNDTQVKSALGPAFSNFFTAYSYAFVFMTSIENRDSQKKTARQSLESLGVRYATTMKKYNDLREKVLFQTCSFVGEINQLIENIQIPDEHELSAKCGEIKSLGNGFHNFVQEIRGIMVDLSARVQDLEDMDLPGTGGGRGGESSGGVRPGSGRGSESGRAKSEHGSGDEGAGSRGSAGAGGAGGTGSRGSAGSGRASGAAGAGGPGETGPRRGDGTFELDPTVASESKLHSGRSGRSGFESAKSPSAAGSVRNIHSDRQRSEAKQQYKDDETVAGGSGDFDSTPSGTGEWNSDVHQQLRRCKRWGQKMQAIALMHYKTIQKIQEFYGNFYQFGDPYTKMPKFFNGVEFMESDSSDDDLSSGGDYTGSGFHALVARTLDDMREEFVAQVEKAVRDSTEARGNESDAPESADSDHVLNEATSRKSWFEQGLGTIEFIRDDVVDCANIGEIKACFEKLLSESLMEMESAERALFSANSDAQSAAVEEDSIEKIVEARKVFIQSGLTHRSLKYVCDQFWDAFRHHREFHDDGRGSAADDNSGSGQPDTTD
jgi:hypothetical protein